MGKRSSIAMTWKKFKLNREAFKTRHETEIGEAKEEEGEWPLLEEGEARRVKGMSERRSLQST